MLNKKLIKIAKTAVGIILVIVLFTSGYITGDKVRKGLEEKEGKVTSDLLKKTDKDKEKQLKEKTKDFLIAYYTKKDLGENRDRYRPFMTEGMYNATISEEEKAATKAYQGYIVDWIYEDADFFVNGDKLEVLVNVVYKNTTLAIKEDRSKQNVRTNKSSYKLTFVKVDNTFLINKMEQMLIEQVKEGV